MSFDIDDVKFDFSKPTRTFRPLPGGDWLARIAEEEKIENPKKGTQGFKVKFLLEQPLDGQDTTDINFAKIRVDDAFWFSQEKLAEATARHQDHFFRHVFPEYDGQETPRMRDLRNEMIGRPIRLTLKVSTKDKDGNDLRWPQVEVLKYAKAS